MKCPRCGNLAWSEMHDGALYYNCLYGHMVPQDRVSHGMTITHTEVCIDLPRPGSKLSLCLGRLAGLGTASTRDIAAKTQQTSDDTASQLTVLRSKGLVVRLNEKKGVEGGSTWTLTDQAKKALKIEV